MKKSKIATSVASLAMAAVLLHPYSAAAGENELLTQMNAAYERASGYENSGNFGMAHYEAAKYASLAETLADSGVMTRKKADIAAAWRDGLRYSPEVYLGVQSDEGVFFGGDGVFVNGSSAVKISMPYGCYAEDYYQFIPSVPGEICISVGLEVTNEKLMRDIAFGKKDKYIIENLRQMSQMEGRVYFAFCPSVNTMRNTRTIGQSFTDAFRHIAKLARRYAPDVKMMLTFGDVTDPGDGTLRKFYPGDGYVDALGVELSHTYNRSYPSSPEAAYDRRGVYYDPVYSVRRISSEMKKIAGKTLPLIIDGCSFPWAGTAARDSWYEDMKRFYTLIPAVCPETVAVLYSNISYAEGMCNLRQNPRAKALYEECLTLPWYIDHREKAAKFSAVSLTEIGSVKMNHAMDVYVYCGSRFSGEEYRIFLNGLEVFGGCVAFKAGTHRFEVYVTTDGFESKLAYDVTVTDSGEFSVAAVRKKYDVNGNGCVDFADAELIMAHVAKWDVDFGDADPDVNGDGKINIKDVSIVRDEITAG